MTDNNEKHSNILDAPLRPNLEIHDIGGAKTPASHDGEHQHVYDNASNACSNGMDSNEKHPNDADMTDRDEDLAEGQAMTKTRKGTTALSWLVIIVIAIVLSYFIRFFITTPYEIPSPSMDDTIAVGDRVMSERISYYVGEPQTGQIVTFADPEPNSNRTLIKRVIATEGQTVDLIGGDVYVDGEKLDEPYVGDNKSYPLTETMEGVDVTYPYTVPDGYVWVMGDNRDESADSRYFGAVATDTVSGHAFMRYWPIDKIGFLE